MITTIEVASAIPTATATFNLPVKYIISTTDALVEIYVFCTLDTNSWTIV